LIDTAYQLAQVCEAIRPFRLHWCPRLRSTSDHAATLRKRGTLYAPAVVLAGRQIKGRGRGANTWWSGPGVLTATFVLPIDPAIEAYQIPLVAGLAVRHAAAKLCDDAGVLLKWPNDLLYGERKLAGLLCERLGGVDLVGIGLNVCPDSAGIPRNLKHRLVSISQIAGRTVNMTTAVCALASSMRDMLRSRTETPYQEILKEYDRYHALIGRRVTVLLSADEAPVSGRCEGLDHLGRLLLRDRGKLHKLIAGQVQNFW